MPHAMNFRLIQSNHSNAANATTMMIDDSSNWEAVPTNATKLHLSYELFKPKLPLTVQPRPEQLR